MNRNNFLKVLVKYYSVDMRAYIPFVNVVMSLAFEIFNAIYYCQYKDKLKTMNKS